MGDITIYEVECMAITFSPLITVLKERGLNKTALKNGKIVSGGTYTTIAKALSEPIVEGVSISAINAICRYLDCQPGDIMEYVPDDPATK